MTDARSAQSLYSYDAAGRQTVVVDPNENRTTFAYDAGDRVTTLTDPNGHTTTYVYDADNEVIDRTDRDGRRVTFAYDSGGRQTNERWLDSSGGTVRTITYSYDADSELTGLTDPDATLTFTYDSGGRQITAATSSAAGQPNVTLTSGYDGVGHRTSLSDNLSSAGLETLSYDSASHLTTITTSYGGTSGPQVLYGYDAANRLTSLSRTVGGSGTAMDTTISYDNASRVTTITHQVEGGSALATYVYGYDNANRLTSEQNAEGTVTYGYDAANELTSASGSRNESYGYDSGGNRNTTGYTSTSGNEMTAAPGETYTYDNQGNLTGKTDTGTGNVWTFSWDYRNRLTGVTEKNSGGSLIMQATYTYDALNRRIGTDISGTQTWFLYDGQNSYADFSGSGTLLTRYLYGPAVDAILGRTSSGGASGWYLTDRLGTARDIANASGAVIDHVVYDSFGDVTNESNPGNGDGFKFAAREYDSTTSLYYDRARYYSPTTGRFDEDDPLGFGGGDANLYRYVANNPTNRTDPSGEIDPAGMQVPPPGTVPVPGNPPQPMDDMIKTALVDPGVRDRLKKDYLEARAENIGLDSKDRLEIGSFLMYNVFSDVDPRPVFKIAHTGINIVRRLPHTTQFTRSGPNIYMTDDSGKTPPIPIFAGYVGDGGDDLTGYIIIGIIHTHPNNDSPSIGDRNDASRLGTPGVVITPGGDFVVFGPYIHTPGYAHVPGLNDNQ